MFVWDKEEHRTRDYPHRPAGDSTFDRSSRGRTDCQAGFPGHECAQLQAHIHMHVSRAKGEHRQRIRHLDDHTMWAEAGSTQEWQEKRPER